MLLLNYQSINVLTYHHSKIPSVCETFFKTIRQNFNYDLQSIIRSSKINRIIDQKQKFPCSKQNRRKREEARQVELGGPLKRKRKAASTPPPPFLQGCDYPDIVVTLDGSSIYKTHWARGGRRLARTRHNVRVTHPAHHAPLAPSPLSLSLCSSPLDGWDRPQKIRPRCSSPYAMVTVAQRCLAHASYVYIMILIEDNTVSVAAAAAAGCLLAGQGRASRLAGPDKFLINLSTLSLEKNR